MQWFQARNCKPLGQLREQIFGKSYLNDGVEKLKKNNEPKLRILMFMYENQDKTFSQTDLAKELDLSAPTISVHTKRLAKDGWLNVTTGKFKHIVSATHKLAVDDDKDFIWEYI